MASDTECNMILEGFLCLLRWQGEKYSSQVIFNEFLNPSLVGGGRKVVAPSFMSSSTVNFDFHDHKPV